MATPRTKSSVTLRSMVPAFQSVVMTHSAQKLVARILTGFEQSTKRGRCRGTGCIADATRLHAVMHRVDRDSHVIGAQQRL